MARTGGEGPRGISAFVVEKDTPGLSFGAQEQKMGWNAQPTAQVVFEGVRVPADAMLGGADGEGTGFGIAMNGLNGGRLNIAACSLGGAQAAFDKASGYLADRQAFGGSLLDEPTVRFTLADMATALQTSRTLLWHAATALDDNHPEKVELCAMAKRYVTDACFEVADQALQLHAATATFASTGWRRSSATCACTESLREPTKSCAWSSAGPRPRGPAHPHRRSNMSTVAFLGLGHMGGPMAANLVAAGHTVRGFDPVPALKAAAPRRAHGLRSGRGGGRADVVITSLPNGEVVEACYAEVLPAATRHAVHRHLHHLRR